MTAAPDPQRKDLTDAREMRALAHPVRIALLELLGRDGPMTATEAGEALGESPANASFHLRTLAKYGFVEEAPGGTGRQRPWQRVAVAHSLEHDPDDPGSATAAKGLAEFFVQRAVDRRRTWEATQTSFAPEWRESSFALDSVTYLTPAELDEVSEAVLAVVHRYRGRVSDRSTRPPGSSPVTIVAWGHPLAPTAKGN